MDIVDVTNAHGAVYDAIAMRNWQSNRPTIPTEVEYCVDCGEPIPEDRRKAVPGCTRCIVCQRAFEERGNY